MSFSFRNLFTQESQEAGGAPIGDAPQPTGQEPVSGPATPTGGGEAGPSGADSQQVEPFQPTPQPTNQGSFEAMFSGDAGPPGATEPVDRSLFSAPEAAVPKASRMFSVREILPFIPPALAAQEGVPMDQSVSVEMPDDGNTDVKLSVIYAVCPALFATEITPLNDSIVTLPAATPNAQTGQPFSMNMDGNLPTAQESGGLPERRQPESENVDPLDTNRVDAEAMAPQAQPAAASVGGLTGGNLFESGVPVSGADSAARENNPFSSAAESPTTGSEPEIVQAEVLPAEPSPAEPADSLEPSGMAEPAEPAASADASPFGFPPPRDESESGSAAFGPFGSAPVPAPGEPQGETGIAAGTGFGFPPSEPAQSASPNAIIDQTPAGGDDAANPFAPPGPVPKEESTAPASPVDSGTGPGEGAVNPFANTGTPVSGSPADPVSQGQVGMDNPFAAPAVAPVEPINPSSSERKVVFHLRDLLGNVPADQIRVDPMQLPVEAMAQIPLQVVEPQLASGSVSLSLAELARHVDPSLASLLQSGNPEARIPLPDNELFHQISDLHPGLQPKPSAPESPPAEPEANPFSAPAAGEFATPFSEQAREDSVEDPAPAFASGSGSPEPAPQAPKMELPENPFTMPAEPAPSGSADLETNAPVDPFAPLKQAENGNAPPEESGVQPASSQPPGFPPADTGPASIPEESPITLGETGTAFPEAAPNLEGAEAPLASLDALAPTGYAGADVDEAGKRSFFDELESAPEQREPAPVSASSAMPVEDEVVSDVELRAVFGVNEAFDLQRVAELSAELPGVAHCAITTPQGVFEAPNRGDGLAGMAGQMVESIRCFAEATGVPNAEFFTFHTDLGVMSIFVGGDQRSLAVRHEPGGFDPGIREKLILVARGIARLKV